MSIPVVERTRFMVGKYEIVAQPIPGAAHMLRYTVFVGKQRIGALVSRPTESDCRFLEKPPVVPPLKIFQVTHRPGRPKKNATPPVPIERNNSIPSLPRDELPAGMSLEPKSDDR
jgi:hypothetical protein